MPVIFDIEALRNVDIRTVDPATLVDNSSVKINTDLPVIEKAYEYITQIGNPYCYRYGDIIVKISYSETTTTITDCMEELIRSILTSKKYK
jgi:hypothetical protein